MGHRNMSLSLLLVAKKIVEKISIEYCEISFALEVRTLAKRITLKQASEFFFWPFELLGHQNHIRHDI